MMRHSEFFYSFCHPLPSTRTLLRALSQYHNRSTVTLVQPPFANLVLLMALSCSVFVDAHRITSNDYIPSNDDVLRAPVPVLTEIYFSMGQLAIRLCNISQRSERKKWIHSFENVTSIIFCASLADYNRWEEDGQVRISSPFAFMYMTANCRFRGIYYQNLLTFFDQLSIRRGSCGHRSCYF